MLIELSSYPKCGNTWLRYIFAKQFDIDVHKGIPDIHQQGQFTRDLVQFVNLHEPVGFYKSHWLHVQALRPDAIVWIYRHPLDVFLSCLNYFYITNNSGVFIDGELRTVDEIQTAGQLEYYFSRFCENLGADYYQALLGDDSNYGTYVERALANPLVMPLQYERLFDKPELVFGQLLERLFDGYPIGVRNGLFERVDQLTKHSGDQFYWKATKENYKNYLGEEQIHRFKERWGGLLAKMGCLDD